MLLKLGCRDFEMRHIRPRPLSLFILFFVPFLASSSSADSRRAYYFGQTKDTAPVDISIQDADSVIHFRIPKNYLTFSENWKGGLQDMISLEVVFPEMIPRSITNETPNSPDVIGIYLYSFVTHGGNHSIRLQIADNISARRWSEVDQYRDDRGQTYKVYVRGDEKEKRSDKARLIKEFLVPNEEDGDADIYFDCLRESKNNFVGCGGRLNYGDDLSLEFHFRRAQLGRWREFRQMTTQLLDRFRETMVRE